MTVGINAKILRTDAPVGTKVRELEGHSTPSSSPFHVGDQHVAVGGSNQSRSIRSRTYSGVRSEMALP